MVKAALLRQPQVVMVRFDTLFASVQDVRGSV